jgi:hypothetical protein
MFRSVYSLSKVSAPLGVSFGLIHMMSSTKSSCSDASQVALSPKEFRPFKIHEIHQISHNTKLYRVDLPSKEHITVCEDCPLLL